MTFTLRVPITGGATSYTARSGTVYTPNAFNYITGVPAGDAVDLITAGCDLIPSRENAPRLPMASGRFYTGSVGDTLEAVLTVASTIYAHPIYIPETLSIATFNVGVTTGQTGGKAHYGLYNDITGYPANLVYDTGEITGLTSTAVVTNTPTTPPSLSPGWYWLASTFAATSTMPSVTGIKALYTNAENSWLGSDTAAHSLAVSGQAATGLSATFTYAALPAAFPTGATLILNADTPTCCLGI